MKESKEHPPSRVFLFILQWTKRQLTPCVDPCLAHVRTIRKKGPMTDLLNCQDGEGVRSWNPSSQVESPPDERFPSLSDSGTQEKGNHLLYLDISARLSETNSTARWHGRTRYCVCVVFIFEELLVLIYHRLDCQLAVLRQL